MIHCIPFYNNPYRKSAKLLGSIDKNTHSNHIAFFFLVIFWRGIELFIWMVNSIWINQNKIWLNGCNVWLNGSKNHRIMWKERNSNEFLRNWTFFNLILSKCFIFDPLNYRRKSSRSNVRTVSQTCTKCFKLQ